MTLGGVTPRAAEVSLPARSLSITDGEPVQVKVVGPLAPGKWAIAVRGHVLPARTSLPLMKNQILRARAYREGSRIVLRLAEQSGDIRETLVRAGLPHDPTSRLIAQALMRFGNRLDAHSMSRMRRLLSADRRDGKPRSIRRASLFALVRGRLPDLDDEGVIRAVDLLSGGRDNSRRRRGEEGPVIEIGTPSSGDEGDALPEEETLCLLNHTRQDEHQWVVVPYRYVRGSREVSGTLRILYDPVARKPTRLTLLADDGTSGQWAFDLSGGAEKSLRVYADPRSAARASGRLRELRPIFNNMGVRFDDIIEDESLFDGFGSVEDDPAQRAGVVDTRA